MKPDLILDAQTQLVTVNDSSPTASVLWDRAVQQAVINDKPGPTVASRAYGVLHTAMFEAWAAYDPTAIATQLGNATQQSATENTDENKTEAMSFAAYRILTELFPSQTALFDSLMSELGFNVENLTTDTTTAAGIGNVSAEAVMSFRREDGSNQMNNYVDTTGYTSVNTSDSIVDIERWTSERVPIDSPDAQLQNFLTPQWGNVTGFSLESPEQFRPQAPQPFLLVEDATVDLDAKTITLADDSVVNISRDWVGSIINPEFIAQAEEVIEFSANLTDEQKLIAEFWEDGGGTSFPPGTWMTFGQFVSARDNHSLDDDAKLFFTLGNAVLDAGIATWEAKVFYDYVRPVRAIRSLGELGLIGDFDAELGGFAIEAWAGPELGTQKILATDFTTYQTPGSDPSPPFAEYTSGHSAFSASGATVLELLSGSDSFNADITFAAGSSRFEPSFTPQADTTLAWDTFSTAADEGGLSRLYGGIHFTEGDINGRTLGQNIGASAFATAQFFIGGGEEQAIDIGTRGDDKLIGEQTDDKLYGRAGNDLLKGRTGNDLLDGGDGDDLLKGGAGDDLLKGGAGDDLLKGGIGDDTMNGGDGDDLLKGKLGDDLLKGGAGDDLLKAGLGNDLLEGGAGNDHLWGGNGDDLLRGGLGNDILIGDHDSGSGIDTFVLAAGEGTDTIVDFQVGIDLIGLADGLLFSQLSLGQMGETVIISFNDDKLAMLDGISVAVLSEANFITV